MATTFKADNGREFEASEHGFVTGDIEVDVNDLIGVDLEGALDLFAERLVGNNLLSDIEYAVAGARDGQIVMRITGNINLILEQRADENDEGTGPSM